MRKTRGKDRLMVWRDRERKKKKRERIVNEVE